jgi:SAM-dependent methyltransferase
MSGQLRELVLGAGNLRRKVLFFSDKGKEYQNPVRVDIDPGCNPDITWDLNKLPYPFKDEEFDEIHAYEILEHLGTQGDWKFFFDQFAELHRVLKDKGHICISVPDGAGRLAWVDPGHTRAFPREIFMFLDQSYYEERVGKSAVADYRHYWKDNLKVIQMECKDNRIYVVLQKC